MQKNLAVYRGCFLGMAIGDAMGNTVDDMSLDAICAEYGANIIDISQSVVGEYFAMIMLVEMDDKDKKFFEMSDSLKALGKSENLVVQAMHEDIFNSMHRI